MKKYRYLLIGLTAAVILLNVFLNLSIYRNQITYLRSFLSGQAIAGSDVIENILMKFENEVNAILFSNSLLNLNISSDDSKQEGLLNLELLFANYNNLISNIYIYDSDKNVLNLSYNKKNELLIDPYITQHLNQLQDRQSVTKSDDQYLYSFPVFNNDDLYANLVFTIDPESFFSSVFRNAHHNTDFWQWIADEQGKAVFSNSVVSLTHKDLSALDAGLKDEFNDFVKHPAYASGKRVFLYSAFAPFTMLGDRFVTVYSVHKSYLFDLIIGKLIISTVASTALLLLFLVLLVGRIGKSMSLKEKTGIDYSTFQTIFDNLPVGIMVLDQHQHTRLVNQTARDMLWLKNDEMVIGKNLTDRFMLSRDYYDHSSSESAFDSNQFVLYRHEGEEVAVYKKDLPFSMENQDYVLSAFVDVTPIEKARKYEAAANTAKSEFLAKMSHEIRTPMNGIIGMTEALSQENLTDDQRDYLQIVKRSADLLLNLIDDILDFSKIEAGKMQLEEIPFKLREEVKLAIDLFRPIIEEKGLELNLKVKPEVPENIIGDSFRLRQVLSNLISNAVKFTHEGEIAVGIELEEEYNNNLTLLFYVEDTGVGIPRSKIESIFNSFTQADESTSRKYGGSGLGTTISKQLVNLMHGEIWAESPSPISRKPNYPGSKFSFTIEVYSNERLVKTINTDKITRLTQINALVLSVNSPTKQRLLRLFEQEKINAEVFEYEAGRFQELKQKLTENAQSQQVIFMLDESSMNGIQLAKKLHEDKLSDLFLMVMISSNHKADNYILTKRIGIDYYIVEPFERTDLFRCLYEAFPHMEVSTTEVVRKLKSNLSVLVAEDNEINIRVAQTIFSNLGIKIDIARNGNETIDKVKSHYYDIVFMDLVMPERDGIQTTVEIRGLGYQMPVVAMTATANTKSKSKALSSGMNDYIVKPVKIDSIRNILLKWFA